jgi:class 3 adenylate cyclase
VQLPDVQYAQTADGLNIAYQVFGDGPWMVAVPGMISNCELFWEHELWRRALEYPARHLRWIMFDKRGVGLSDRFIEYPTLEQRIQDIEAVMDAVGVERAHMLGQSEGGLMAQLFAANRPERVDRLCLLNSAFGPDQVEQLGRYTDDLVGLLTRLATTFEELVEAWGVDPSVVVKYFAPSMVDNESIVRWMGRWTRLSATRADFQRQVDAVRILAVGDAPSRVQAPTLIMHVVGDRVAPVIGARLLHDLIPGSQLIEFPGTDHMVWLQDNWQEVADAAIEFYTGTRPSAGTQRRFATIMFTDIVESTTTASRLGDLKWRTAMESHDRIAWTTTDLHRGRIVKSTGDGILAIFDTPSAAVACALDVRREVAALGIDLRIGLHAGEIELRDDADVIGLAVNIAARVEQTADAKAILASSTVRDLLVGSPYTFIEHGTHKLKGVDGAWTLYNLT